MTENEALPPFDWDAFARAMGYSPVELAAFRSYPNNAFVAQHANRLDKWTIVAEVVDSHGCAAGHKRGDQFYVSPHGVYEADKGPMRVCLQVFTALAPAVAVIQERIISGLDPAPYLYRHVGCLDVGVGCGGWGHVAFKLYAIPKE